MTISAPVVTVGQREIETQRRVIDLFRDELGYAFLGSFKDDGHQNVEALFLRRWLREQGHSETVITRALFELERARALGGSRTLYTANRDVYTLLRYGAKVSPDVGEHKQTVWLIDWDNPENNEFAFAEEVTVVGPNTKRLDIVLYVNGIALAVLELKRSTVSVAEGIRQNLDNQKREFVESFFSTVQLLFAGNETEGLRYGVIQTPEKYWLTWKDETPPNPSPTNGPHPNPSPIAMGEGLSPLALRTGRGGQGGEGRPGQGAEGMPLHQALSQMARKDRLLEIIHDFMVFDAGTKKVCRHNQYFGVRAAHRHVKSHEGGIIWHTQGSGKSLTMVWLAKWIKEHVTDPRVLIITDRTELDEQIEGVFKGVDEEIYRTRSGADLVRVLNDNEEWLICSLVHKFPGDEEGDFDAFIDEVSRGLPSAFRAKGDLFVFVDECHRTQSGKLHEAMKALLPDATLIGFTGTPLLKKDKRKSIEVFGPYIHTYKYNDAVRDNVVLDLRYEARDIDQDITSPEKIDTWFEAKTGGLTEYAQAQLKARWGTMQKVLSSEDRLGKIADDILMDMEIRPRLRSGHGNAMLVTSDIYAACRIYEMFQHTPLAGKCAIVTSYRPSPSDMKGEESGEGETEPLFKYQTYRKMLAAHFDESEETAVTKADIFEREVKKRFVDEPGQMKLLIVVDKLLTGFDAPPATYLYIDKQMRDHALFQAICRVNRLDGEDKDYGYIVDYKDLFLSLQRSIEDYTGGAFDQFDAEDVAGLLENRLTKGRERLEEAREAIKALCERVEPPQDTAAFLHYFCAEDTTDAEAVKTNAPRRVLLYKLTTELLRAYANIANEMAAAGYDETETEAVKREAVYYEKVRKEVKLASGDYIDLKLYEPAMRHLLDAYIRAEESEVVSTFEDMTLVELIVRDGEGAIAHLPKGIRDDKEAVAETIENNVRRVIIDEMAVNPAYYAHMSDLLDALIQARKKAAVDYKVYLAGILALARQVANKESETPYPVKLATAPQRAFYDNLNGDEETAIRVDRAIRETKQDSWRGNLYKERMIKAAILRAVGDESAVEPLFELAKNQHEY
jgi:type I restriction enzyme R subunit